jgi:hypothetical protein
MGAGIRDGRCAIGDAPALLHRREVLDEEERQRALRAQERRLPAVDRTARRLAAAFHRVAHIDAAGAHCRHVRRQVVALQDDVADAPARLDVLGQVGAPALRRLLLRRVVDREELEIVLPVERERIVRALARVRAAGVDVEAHLAVLLHAPLEIGDADHDVIDASKHKDEG